MIQASMFTAREGIGGSQPAVRGESLNKRQLLTELLGVAKDKAVELKRASKDAQERANEAEGAMQSRYDTFKEEGQYLAGGLKARYLELKNSVAMIENLLKSDVLSEHDDIQHYSYIEVEFDDGRIERFFMTPVMGGERLLNDITIITPSAPVGHCLMGREVGDQFSYRVGKAEKKGEIIHVF